MDKCIRGGYYKRKK